MRIEDPSGLYTADVMDFWRPNYRDTALVDGQESVGAYLQAVEGTWKDYTEQGGRTLEEFAAFCYHQPFTKMAYKAHRHLLNYCGRDTDPDTVTAALGQTTAYNRVIGNSYTASVYLALAALLDQADDLTGKNVGFLSYGSGSVAEFFALSTVVAGYRDHLRTAAHHEAITRRTEVGYDAYRALHEHRLPRPTAATTPPPPRPPAPTGWRASAATNASTPPAEPAPGDHPGRAPAQGARPGARPTPLRSTRSTRSIHSIHPRTMRREGSRMDDATILGTGSPIRDVRILGTGAYVPERIVSNDEVSGAPAGVDDAWITRKTAIRERRWAAPGQATSDLATAAARAAMQAA